MKRIWKAVLAIKAFLVSFSVWDNARGRGEPRRGV